MKPDDQHSCLDQSCLLLQQMVCSSCVHLEGAVGPNPMGDTVNRSCYVGSDQASIVYLQKYKEYQGYSKNI